MFFRKKPLLIRSDFPLGTFATYEFSSQALQFQNTAMQFLQNSTTYGHELSDLKPLLVVMLE